MFSLMMMPVPHQLFGKTICLFGLLVLPVVNMLLPVSIPFCHSNNFTCLAIFSTVIFENFELNAEMQECSKTVFIAVLFIHQ